MTFSTEPAMELTVNPLQGVCRSTYILKATLGELCMLKIM